MTMRRLLNLKMVVRGFVDTRSGLETLGIARDMMVSGGDKGGQVDLGGVVEEPQEVLAAVEEEERWRVRQ